MKRSTPRTRQVTIEVPGTTANLGTGLDALGLALGISNRCRIRCTGGRGMEWQGASKRALRMMQSAASAFFQRAGRKPIGFSFEVNGDVPVARGLGSSVTVRLGIVAGLNRLCGSPLDGEELLSLVTKLEGHPDNAAPAVFGGFAVSALDGKMRVMHVRFRVDPSLKFLLIIPEAKLETEKARKILPRVYSRADAAHNLGRACLLTAALVSKRYELLWCGVDDRLHQPYRARLIRPLYPVLKAARSAGALGGWLSGSGSTICIVTRGDVPKILRAVRKAIPRSIPWTCKVVRANNRGFRIL